MKDATGRPRHGGGSSTRSPAGTFAMVAASIIALVVGIGFYAVTHPRRAASSTGAAHPKATALATGLRQSGLAVPVGVTDQNLVGEPLARLDSDISAMKSIGVSSVRIAAQWNLIQPNGPATYDWTQLDRTVEAFRRSAISVDMVINGSPPWAAAAGVDDSAGRAQPASATQFATFAGAVAEHYAPDGVSLFEIWNEPNLPAFWSPAANPKAYVADLEAAYIAIKAVDHSALVISGGLSPAGYARGIDPIEFLQEIYQDGAQGYLDGVGYHAYSYPEMPSAPGTGWAKMDRTVPSLRSVMKAYGDSAKKIWVTEYGAPSAGRGAIGGISVGGTGEASEISQAIADAEKIPWIGALYIYSWRDSTDAFGLLTAAGTRKPAYYAVASATARLSH